MLHGRYSDGLRPVAHDVEVARAAQGLEIRIVATGNLVPWSFAETRIDREEGEARLHRIRAGVDTGERLVLNLAVFERAFAGDLKSFGKGRAGEASGWRIAAWSGGAIASVLLIFFVGLPLLAQVATPLIPLSWERRIGQQVEPQVLDMFGGREKVQACGKPDGPGLKALNEMTRQLIGNRELPFAPRVDVLNVQIINAFALPGGRIYLFRPVIERASGPDEIAGVLAHEIGHVVHRHTMRAILHNSALSLLVGLLLGDVTGGITVSILTNLVGSAYSRDAEREADQVSVEMMAAAGADPRAINAFFNRLASMEGGGGFTNLFRSHPVTTERIAAVEKMSAGVTGARRPILDGAEWAALKNICKE
jgi:Zn-dependent protease with chaperone function